MSAVIIQWNPRTWSIKEAFVARSLPKHDHVNPWSFGLKQFGFASLNEAEAFCSNHGLSVDGYCDINLNSVTRDKMLTWDEFGRLPA